MDVVELAPAKVNLYLHVGPVRPDGLHELASLFVFAGVGDVVSVERSDSLSLEIAGPFAAALAGEDPSANLVVRAATALRAASGVGDGARIVLDKRLPVAAGVGGGSADAAAALRALIRLWSLRIEPQALRRLAFALGADVPACLSSAPSTVTGAGELVGPAAPLPPVWICLANPLVGTPTGPVFRAFDAANPSPPSPSAPPFGARSIDGLRASLAATRNDLQPPACALAPVVADVVGFLAARPGAFGARMSGSGATAFAVFASGVAAERAARAARARGWWSAAAPLLSGAGGFRGWSPISKQGP